MKKLSCPDELNALLKDYIEQYNSLEEDDHLQKLFFLQKITRLMQTLPANIILSAWRNAKDGIETHLQHYGIHRDASFLVQSIEFAQAIMNHSQDDIPLRLVDEDGFYASLQKRDQALESDKISEEYIQANIKIFSHYFYNPVLGVEVTRSLHYLSLSYAKLMAMRQEIIQTFDNYETRPLGEVDEEGNPKGNNKNYIFTIDGEQLVIRVEDRENLGREGILQSYPVREYFSKDYVTTMMPFVSSSHPLVISEFATEGDLLHFAKKLAEQGTEDRIQQSLSIFLQLTDFCTKLMESGHFHPDIKLSNFLTDGLRVILSDRKSLHNKETPHAGGGEMMSSPVYAAPEYLACLKKDAEGNTIINPEKAMVTISMPPYMAYQLGMALKEFLLESQLIPTKDLDQNLDLLESWSAISFHVPEHSPIIRNLVIVALELTRELPEDRLTIAAANELLTCIDQSTEAFLLQLEALSPKSKLVQNKATEPDVAVLRQLLSGSPQSLEQKQILAAMKFEDIVTCFEDPRSNLPALLESAKDNLILQEDRRQAFFVLRWLYDLTGWEFFLPRVTTWETLQLLPNRPDLVDICDNIAKILYMEPAEDVETQSSEPEQPTEDSISKLANLSAPREKSAKVEETIDDAEVETSGSCVFHEEAQSLKTSPFSGASVAIGGLGIFETIPLGNQNNASSFGNADGNANVHVLEN